MTCTTPVAETADRVLAHLQAQHTRGVATTHGRKIVTALGANAQAVKHALGFLLNQGKIEEVGTSVYCLTAASLPATPIQAPVAPAKAAPVEHWDGTGPRWWPTVVPGRPRYYPVAGKAPEKVLLAFDRFPHGARPKDISRALGEEVSNRLAELVTYGVLAKDGHGLYRLATTPPAPVASGATGGAEPVSEPAGEAGGDAGEATGGADLPPAVGRRTVEGLPATAVETALAAELEAARREVTHGPESVRLLVQALDGETLEAAVVRHLAKLDHHVETARESSRKATVELVEARKGCERLRRQADVAKAERDSLVDQSGKDADLIDAICAAVGLPRESATDEAIMEATVGQVQTLKRQLSEIGPAPEGMRVRDAARKRYALGGADAQALEGALAMTERELATARREAESANGLQAAAERDAAGWKSRAERVLAEGQAAAAQLDGVRDERFAHDRARRDAEDEYRRLMRLPPGRPATMAHVVEALAAKVMHLDDIARALGTPELNHLLLAAEARSLMRQVQALEKVAQRQPVAPGPRLLHPQGHPAVTAAKVEAVGKLCAVEDLRDALAVDDDATPGEVVSVVLASRTADHARIAELQAELADTRRRLTFATCEARDLRAKASRTLGQRVARAISAALKGVAR